MDNKRNITFWANKKLEYDSVYSNNDFSTPEKVLDFLKDDTKFKNLSDILKETMEKKNFCSPGSKDSTYTNILFTLLSEQDKTLKEKDRRHYKKAPGKLCPWRREQVSDWIKGITANITDYEEMVSICFALKLNYDESNELMNKCGFLGFNIRNIEDSVFSYCLFHNNSLKDAYAILDEYKEQSLLKSKTANVNKSLENNTHGELSRNNTTRLMKNKIFNPSWEKDDFIEKYLIYFSKDFISYSKTTLFEYYSLKNPIFFEVLRYYIISKEYNDYSLFVRERKSKSKKYTIIKSDVIVTLNFINTINQIVTLQGNPNTDIISFFTYIKNKIVAKATKKPYTDSEETAECFTFDCNLDTIIDEIENYYNDNAEKDSFLQFFSLFLSAIISPDKMFQYYLPALNIYGADPICRRRCINEIIPKYEELKNNVYFKFPQRNFISGYENNPSYHIHDCTLRKCIILLFYLKYSSERLISLSDKKSNSNKEYTFNLFAFRDEMNDILNRCNLGELYPANRYDFLILRCVADLFIPKSNDYNYTSSDDVPKPFVFLGQILALSFGDNEYDSILQT